MNPNIKEYTLKIIQDKLFIGLLIVGVLTIFIGYGFNNNQQDEAEKQAKLKSKESYHIISKSSDQSKNAQNSNEFAVEPNLATDFVKWWLGGAMDFNPATAQKNHEESVKWMTNDAKSMFNANFWSPDLSYGILNGKYAGKFVPTEVKALAINPDGTVVVGFSGNMLFQTSTQPTIQQVLVDVLVAKDKQGLRIAGLYNRTMPIIGQVVR